jgi:hypothetical protein
MTIANRATGHNGHLSDEQIIAQLPPELSEQFKEWKRSQDNNPTTADQDAAEEKAEREKFPADCLPSELLRFATNVSDATKMPLIIPCTAGIACLSASLGRGIAVETNPGELICGNTYILPVVNSGLGKSRSSKPMLEPLYSMHDSLQEQWAHQHNEDITRIEELKKEIAVKQNELLSDDTTDAGKDELRKQITSRREELQDLEADTEPNLFTAATTEPALAELLKCNNEVMSSISSEAGGAIQFLAGKYANKKGNDVSTEDSLLLSAYCQERYKYDTLHGGKSDLKEPTVSLYWMFQERYIPMVFGNQSLATGGFIARCLTFNSNAEPEEETGDEPAMSDELRASYKKIINLLFYKYRRSEETEIVQPSKDAKTVMREYHNECVRLAKGELRDVQQFPLRWRENAWKLALIFHAAAFGIEAPKYELRLDTATKAIRLMRWFTAEFLNLMAGGREDQADAEGQWLVTYINSKGEGQPRRMSVREVCHRRKVKVADVRRIIANNSKCLRIEVVRPKSGGTPTEFIMVGCR